MSSYGEKRDRQDERMRGDLKAMQDGIQSSRATGRSGPVNKKKNVLMCLSFLLFLIIAIVVVVVINLD
jgi:hypothetical protein